MYACVNSYNSLYKKGIINKTPKTPKLTHIYIHRQHILFSTKRRERHIRDIQAVRHLLINPITN